MACSGVQVACFLLSALGCSGPTSTRRRRDASDISETGGTGGEEETGGSGGDLGGGTGGTGGGGSGGTGGDLGGSGGDSGGTGGSAQPDAAGAEPDAAVDAASPIDAASLAADVAADLAVDAAMPDLAVDLAADQRVNTPDLALDMALPPDLGRDAPAVIGGLANHWKFDESGGLSAFDSTLSENTGTLTNGALFAPGTHFPNPGFTNTGALTLDGVNDYVVFGTTGVPDPGGAHSISLWVNYASVPSGNHNFISLTSATALCGLQIGFRAGELRAWKWGGATLASRAAPPASGWHNIIYTFDGTTHSLIVDGVTAAGTTTAQPSCPVSLVEVGGTETNKELFAGNVDDVRLYNRMISASEIALLAGGADPVMGPKLDAGPPDTAPAVDLTTGLVGRWKLDEGTGTTTADSSGNGNNGTIAGNPTWPAGFPAAQFTNPHALALDGTGDQVAVGVTNFAALDQARSVSLWFNYATVPASGNKTFFSITNRAANATMGAGFQIGTRGSNLSIWAIGGTVYAMTPAPAVGWHHLVYTFDGTTHVMYLDGAQAMTSAVVPPNPQNVAPAEAMIGNYLNGSERFTGSLDDVRVWKARVLTSSEVSALFSGQ
jgi:hypothetical protein